MENPKDHYVGNVAQKAIIEKDGSVLVVRGISDKVWEFPGGRLHAGEIPKEGLAREIKEELGIVVLVGSPVHICRSFHGQSKQWQVFTGYLCSIVKGNIVVDKSELEEFRWISRGELKTLPMFDDCRELADVFLAG